MFGFDFLNRVTCPLSGCKCVSIRPEAAKSLQLTFTSDDKTLESLLVRRALPGKLDGDNGWKHACELEHDPKKQAGVLTLTVDVPPNILIIHLNRFTYPRSGTGHRLDNRIKYPVELVHKSLAAAYKLVAVGRHSGSFQGGHYFAWVRYGDTWWKCDDEKVTPLERFSPDSEDGARAYMLFYEKLDKAGEAAGFDMDVRLGRRASTGGVRTSPLENPPIRPVTRKPSSAGGVQASHAGNPPPRRVTRVSGGSYVSNPPPRRVTRVSGGAHC